VITIASLTGLQLYKFRLVYPREREPLAMLSQALPALHFSAACFDCAIVHLEAIPGVRQTGWRGRFPGALSCWRISVCGRDVGPIFVAIFSGRGERFPYVRLVSYDQRSLTCCFLCLPIFRLLAFLTRNMTESYHPRIGCGLSSALRYAG